MSRRLLKFPRNEALDVAMAAAGFNTYMDLARASGVHFMSVYRLSKMETGLTYGKGKWTPVALKVAAALQVHPTLLQMGEVKRVKEDHVITEEDRLSILAEVNPPETPFEAVAREDDEEVADDLFSGLPHQMREVLEGRAAGKTLEEVGREMGVTRERVRQIEMKACRLARFRLRCAEKES